MFILHVNTTSYVGLLNKLRSQAQADEDQGEDPHNSLPPGELRRNSSPPKPNNPSKVGTGPLASQGGKPSSSPGDKSAGNLSGGLNRSSSSGAKQTVPPATTVAKAPNVPAPPTTPAKGTSSSGAIKEPPQSPDSVVDDSGTEDDEVLEKTKGRKRGGAVNADVSNDEQVLNVEDFIDDEADDGSLKKRKPKKKRVVEEDDDGEDAEENEEEDVEAADKNSPKASKHGKKRKTTKKDIAYEEASGIHPQ